MSNQPLIRLDAKSAILGRIMIGVILWTDPSDKQAVIWCEDHGDLAYLSAPNNAHLPDHFFEVGDMVEFEVSTQRNLRLAHNTKQLAATFGSSLTKVLHASANLASEEPGDSAKIVPFQIPPTKKTTHAPPTIRRRRV